MTPDTAPQPRQGSTEARGTPKTGTGSGSGSGPSGPRAERKRRAIVTAARTLFLREGFGVGMDAIAAEASVSKVTVYNHFGSKEALFTAVVAGALDDPAAHGGGEDPSASLARLAGATDLRAAFLEVARAWVHAVRDDREVAALRTLVAAELHRFPELGRAWQHDSPTGHHPAVAGALRTLAERGLLDVPDLEVATLQLYALLVHPHMVFGQYGAAVDDDLTERLLVAGVDMFLGRYARHSAGD
ncbi:TetR/AcrR family transcriptional regulator [Streptomyces amakusaensis]|uniref:TetR/AcrR family transcriptional regulator n=1 Tax=Streptomyces amakusaensis TaxID=67271 RepID=A0ABW0AUD7_9ACTN